MKLLSATSLLVAAVVSVVACIPFMPAAKERPDLFALEVRMQTKSAGRVQVYYDTGTGFDEAQSVAEAVSPSDSAATHLLPLPPGEYKRFRLDPIDRDGRVVIESLRVVTRDGQPLRVIELSSLSAAHQIAALNTRGPALEVAIEPGANDPQLVITLDPPLRLERSWRIVLFSGAWRIVAVFVSLVALLAILDRAPRVRGWFTERARTANQKPARVVAVVAGLSVLLSCYPVVFLGKSFVSPNLGTVLLYENFPTLPGYEDESSSDVMGSDIGAIMWQHVPLSMVQARALRHGELPLWNRYNSSGTPLLGQGQSMFGDPLHFLVVAANGASWAWDAKYVIAKWLLVLGLGLLVLQVTRDQGYAHGTLAAVLVAATAPFIGFFLYRVNHPAYFSVCYAPWPLYCWFRAIAGRDWRDQLRWATALIVANVALMNSGTAKEAYMLLLTMNLAGGCVLLSAAIPWRAKVKTFAILAWAGVVFVLLSAPIWGTFLHELHNAYTSYNGVSAYQIQPSLLLGAFDEAFYRPVTPAMQTFSPSLNFFLLLGLLYFLATFRTHFANRAALGLAAASLLPLALAFGLVPPAWIVRVPFLANIAHIDNTFSCALLVLWAVLAGAGFARALGRLGTVEGRHDWIAAGAMLGVMVFAWIAFGHAIHRPIYGPAFTVNDPNRMLPVPEFLWGYLATLLTAVLVLVTVVHCAARRRHVTVPGVLVSILCVAILCWRHGQQAPSTGFESYVTRPMTRVDFHAKSEAVSLVQSTQAAEPSRAYGIRGNFFPGWTAAYGLETVHGPDALMSPWYRELTGAMGGFERIWDWRLYLEPKNVAAARPYFDALNVRYYLDLRSDQGLMGRTVKLARAADLDVYESPSVWPRAFFTDRVLAYDRVEDFTRQLREGDGRPFAAFQSTDAAAKSAVAALWGEWKQRTVVPATTYRLSTNTTEFDVQATGPGVVLLTEAWWPGDFRAFVNGVKTPIVRLNHAFKGVAIKGAGDFHVVFRYVPKNWYRNVALFATGAVLLALSLGATFRRKPHVA